jgi:hypothetical protein
MHEPQVFLHAPLICPRPQYFLVRMSIFSLPNEAQSCISPFINYLYKQYLIRNKLTNRINIDGLPFVQNEHVYNLRKSREVVLYL